MGFLAIAAKVLLPTLTVVGFMGTHKLAMDDGMFDMIQHNMKSASPRLEGTNDPLLVHMTGIDAIDGHIGLMISFFWPVLSGKLPALSLQATHFYGQMLAIWLVMLIESFRVGNSWKLVSFITVTGLAIENFAAAVIIPLWCALHFYTSPTAAAMGSVPVAQRKTSLLAHPAELRILPWAVLLGCGIPTALVLYSSPTASLPLYKSQQFWIAVRQIHPLLTTIIHLIISILYRSPDNSFLSTEERNKGVLKALRNVYAVATYVALVPHVAVFSLSIFAQIMPSVFAEGYPAMLSPFKAFWPVAFWSSPTTKVNSVAIGSLLFLQWDELVACAAPLIWAFVLNRQAVADAPQASSLLSSLVRNGALIVLGGPACAIVSLMRERDAVVLDLSSDVQEKKNL